MGEVAWTDTLEGVPIAAALPPARRCQKGYSIAVVPGLTRQVWFTFHPLDVPAGTHRGKVVVHRGEASAEATIELNVFPLRFPDHPTLHLGGWDYTDSDAYEVTPQNRTALIANLREHFVDSPWAQCGVLAPGQYDSSGCMVTEPDTAAFDRWLARWPHAGQYCIFASVNDSFAASPTGSAEFEAKVRSWITFWAAHAKSRGLRPEQIVILLVDEPSTLKEDATILAWARAIRAAATGVKVFEDPCHADPAKADQKMMAACDVLCPQRPMFMAAPQAFRDYYWARHKQGTELAFYICSGPLTAQDPYSSHRLHAWWCWRYGAAAEYFWAFGDCGGGSCWNEYALAHDRYSPLFIDASSVTDGKHMEAIREGVEDYEYLVMLQRSVTEKSGAARPRWQKPRSCWPAPPRPSWAGRMCPRSSGQPGRIGPPPTRRGSRFLTR